jgi:hypothetical protein
LRVRASGRPFFITEVATEIVTIPKSINCTAEMDEAEEKEPRARSQGTQLAKLMYSSYPSTTYARVQATGQDCGTESMDMS